MAFLHGYWCLFASKLKWFAIVQGIGASVGVVEARIVEKLRTAFAPTVLTVVSWGSLRAFPHERRPLQACSYDLSVLAVQVNDSHKHAVPKGAETHFSVTVVTPVFEGVKLIDRHRMVNQVLADELTTGVHALSITAKTPAQWEASPVPNSTPSCAGGHGK
jgi:BolA-like protein 1